MPNLSDSELNHLNCICGILSAMNYESVDHGFIVKNIEVVHEYCTLEGYELVVDALGVGIKRPGGEGVLRGRQSMSLAGRKNG